MYIYISTIRLSKVEILKNQLAPQFTIKIVHGVDFENFYFHVTWQYG